MTEYSNPRMHAVIDNWPLGGNERGTAIFDIEQKAGKGERAVRRTVHPRKGESKPKALTFAAKARIVDGDDGRTYIAELSPMYRHIVIMQSGMQFQAEVIYPNEPRYAELSKLFDDGAES